MWLLLSLPLLRSYRQRYFVERRPRAVAESFRRLGRTLANVKRKRIFFCFCWHSFSISTACTPLLIWLQLTAPRWVLIRPGLLLALLVLQVVAFPCSIFFGRLAVRYRAEQLILVCILAYFGIALFAMILSTQAQFWVLAVLVGIFQGGVQALSRSYFTKIIPAEQSGEYFGLMDICGKGASFLGTTLVGVVSQATGDIHLGVGVIAVLFAVGAVLFCLAVRVPPEKA